MVRIFSNQQLFQLQTVANHPIIYILLQRLQYVLGVPLQGHSHALPVILAEFLLLLAGLHICQLVAHQSLLAHPMIMVLLQLPPRVVVGSLALPLIQQGGCLPKQHLLGLIGVALEVQCLALHHRSVLHYRNIFPLKILLLLHFPNILGQFIQKLQTKLTDLNSVVHSFPRKIE